MTIQSDARAATGRRQDFLQLLSDHLRPLADPREIQAEACRMVAGWLDVDRTYYVEVDEAAGIARVERDYVRNGVNSLAGEHALADFNWSLDLLRRGDCHAISDTRTAPEIPDADRMASVALDIISGMGAPLLKAGALVGVLCVTASRPREWTGEERQLLCDVVDRIWSAIGRARAESSLNISEARHRSLVDAMDEAVCVFERLPLRPDGRRDYRYISMNRAMLTLFGIPDLSGQSIRDNFPDEVEDWYDDYDRVLETGVPIRFERETVPQGMFLEMFVTRIEDGSGRSLMAVMKDVTGRKLAEKALRESEERLRALVNATSDVVYRMSADWRVMRELDGRGFIQDAPKPRADWLTGYIPEEDHKEVLAAIAQAIRTKSTFQMEHRVKRPDGTLGWTFSRAIPLLDEAGEIVEWFGTASDVTDRRKAVEALLHTQRLDAVSRLASSIAHDFNNLLTVIIANIELAETRPDEAARKSFLDKAMRAAQLGEDLNNRLLVWAGQSVPKPKLLDLNRLVQEMSAILDRSIGEKIVLSRDLAPDLWTVFIDPTHIDSAILNLAVNARDAMPNGGEIHLATANVAIGAEAARAHPEAAPGDYVRLSITDTGAGMSEEVRKHALEPFFTTKEHGTGMGLGLFSVQSMVKQSGGFLEIESAPGQGTTFRLYLPRKRRPVEDVDGVARKGRYARDGRVRVLLVEDQKTLREATRARLELLGYEVVEAANARNALAMLAADRGIGLVFSDVVMPGDLSGRDLAREVLGSYPEVAVLLTSGYSSGADPADAADPTGSVPLLHKPYLLRELEDALDRLLTAKFG